MATTRAASAGAGPSNPSGASVQSDADRQNTMRFASAMEAKAVNNIKTMLEGPADFEIWTFQMELAIETYSESMLRYDRDYVFPPKLFCQWAVQSFGTFLLEWYRSAVVTNPALKEDWSLLLAALKGMYYNPTKKWEMFSEFRDLKMLTQGLSLTAYHEHFDRLCTVVEDMDEKWKTMFYVDGLRPNLGNAVRDHFTSNNLPLSLAVAREKAYHVDMEHRRAEEATRQQTARAAAVQRKVPVNKTAAGTKFAPGPKFTEPSPDAILRNLHPSPKYPNWRPSTLAAWAQQGEHGSHMDKMFSFCEHNKLCFICKRPGHRANYCRSTPFGTRPTN